MQINVLEYRELFRTQDLPTRSPVIIVQSDAEA